VCVFVNGLFNPKAAPGTADADDWASTKASLESTWAGCEALHVHNPTLAVDAEKLFGKAVQGGSSAKLALGASFFALTLAAVDTYLETGQTARVIGAAMDSTRSTLAGKAHEVSQKIEAELLRLVAPRGASDNSGKDDAAVERLSAAMGRLTSEAQAEPQSTDASAHLPPRGPLELLDLVAHSHGGWCVSALIESGGLARVLDAAPQLRVRLWVLGCPVLVEIPPDDKLASRVSVLQLHNELDVVSLRYEPDAAKKRATHVVRTSDRGIWHSLKKYLLWLPEVLSAREQSKA
jgi:hypothetical protein